jgi:hypothetical protein
MSVQKKMITTRRWELQVPEAFLLPWADFIFRTA